MNRISSQFVAAELDRADAALDAGQIDAVRAAHDRIRQAIAAPPSEYLTTQEAAELLGVASINTVKAMIKSGEIAGQRTRERSHFRIPRASVEAFLRSPRYKRLMEEEEDRALASDYSVPDELMDEAIAQISEERRAARR